jgi:hypothetical protein
MVTLDPDGTVMVLLSKALFWATISTVVAPAAGEEAVGLVVCVGEGTVVVDGLGVAAGLAVANGEAEGGAPAGMTVIRVDQTTGGFKAV